MKYKEIKKNQTLITEDEDFRYHAKNGGKKKMAYNAQKAKEIDLGLPKDTVLDGVVTNIEDGKIKDFVEEKYHSKFEGGVDTSAIQLTMEVKNSKTEEIVKITQMLTYQEKDGQTLYGSGSNMGKYHKKYGKLPEAGDQVKISTNGEGFGKLKLD